MLLTENVQLSLEGLKSNKMRALLTMLGIIIGIGSVIAIVTVGDSMTASVSSSMQSLGATNIMVAVQKKDAEARPGPQARGGGNIPEADLITDDMIERYAARYERNITAIGLSSSSSSGKAQEGRLYANVSIVGTNDGYGLVSNIHILEGRFLREGDVKSNRYVAVVSDKLIENMFDSGENPLGKEIKINTDESIQTFTIVGVFKHEDSFAMGPMGSGSSGKDIRTNLYIPITLYQRINSLGTGYQSLTVMARSDIDSVKFAEDTKNYFNTFYANNTRYEIGAMSMESMMSAMTDMLGIISIAVAVIAGISLLVGGIGVMNIMLVSVTERTREIGTRKALGARNSAVRTQFIVEAVIICGIGGLIGVLTGIGLGYVGSILLGSPIFPSPFIIIIAVLFSMLIGVFFGYYPANKAAKLDPIEALRYE